MARADKFQLVPDGWHPIEWIRHGRALPGEQQTWRKGKMITEPGTWKARMTAATINETAAGALMAALAFDVASDPPSHITGYMCLASKAGEVQQKTIASLREAFGWDGADPFWLSDTDLGQVEVEIVVELENDQNGQPKPRVRWVNRPGRAGNGALPPEGNRQAILAKYGAKLRALSGGNPVKPVTATPAAAPKPPAPKAAPPAPTPAPAGKTATMQDAWGAFCDASQGKYTEATMTDLWWKLIQQAANGKTADQCTPADWAAVADAANDFLANQVPM